MIRELDAAVTVAVAHTAVPAVGGAASGESRRRAPGGAE